MKKVVVLIMAVWVMGSVGAQNTDLSTMKRIVDQWSEVNEQTAYWTHDNQGLVKHRVLVEPYLGHPSDTLKAISDSINKLMHLRPEHALNRDMFYDFKMQIADYHAKHPKERMECCCLLGDLYRYASPRAFCNYERAAEYYYMAYLATPQGDKRLRGNIHMRMALSRLLDMDKTMDFTYTIHNLYYAIQDDPYFASKLGECFMLGIGVYQDLGLAMSLLDLGAMSGDDNCYLYLNMIRYMVEHRPRNNQERLAEEKWQEFMVRSRIESNPDEALMCLYQAVSWGNINATYQLARMYEDMLSDQYSEDDQQHMKEVIFSNYRKAADAGFMPAMFDLAVFCANHTYDTAQGNIYKPNKKGEYNEKDRKVVLQQSLDLMERTASLHYGKAYSYLGDLYGQGGMLNVPAKNHETSARYHILAARRGSQASLGILNGYVSGGLVKRERMEELVKEMEDVVLMQDVSRTSIGQHAFDQLGKASFKRTPFSFYSEYINVAICSQYPDPLLDEILGKCYHLAYNAYAVKMSEEVFKKDDLNYRVSESHNMYLRNRMKDIRESFNRKRIGKPITKSIYEENND